MTQGVEFKSRPAPPTHGYFPPSLNTPLRGPRQFSQQSLKKQQKPPRPAEQAQVLQARIDHMKQLQHDLLILEEEQQQVQEQARSRLEASQMNREVAHLPPHLQQAQLELERREEALRMERARLDLEAQRVELHKKEQQMQIQMQALSRNSQQGKPKLQKIPPQLLVATRPNPGGLPYNRDMVMGNLRAHFFGTVASEKLSVGDLTQRRSHHNCGA